MGPRVTRALPFAVESWRLWREPVTYATRPHTTGFRRMEKVADGSRNRGLVREAKVRFSRRTRNRTVGLRFSAGWFEIPIPLPRPRIQARIFLGSSQEAAEVAEVFSPIPLRCLCVLLLNRRSCYSNIIIILHSVHDLVHGLLL